MTKDEWDEAWWMYYNTALKQQPSNPRRAFERAHKVMLLYHGPRPKEAGLSKPGLVSVVKTGLMLKRRLSMPFKFTVQFVVAALVAGASAFGAAHLLANADGIVTTGEWVTIAWSTVSAVIAALFTGKSPAPSVK